MSATNDDERSQKNKYLIIAAGEGDLWMVNHLIEIKADDIVSALINSIKNKKSNVVNALTAPEHFDLFPPNEILKVKMIGCKVNDVAIIELCTNRECLDYGKCASAAAAGNQWELAYEFLSMISENPEALTEGVKLVLEKAIKQGNEKEFSRLMRENTIEDYEHVFKAIIKSDRTEMFAHLKTKYFSIDELRSTWEVLEESLLKYAILLQKEKIRKDENSCMDDRGRLKLSNILCYLTVNRRYKDILFEVLRDKNHPIIKELETRNSECLGDMMQHASTSSFGFTQ